MYMCKYKRFYTHRTLYITVTQRKTIHKTRRKKKETTRSKLWGVASGTIQSNIQAKTATSTEALFAKGGRVGLRRNAAALWLFDAKTT